MKKKLLVEAAGATVLTVATQLTAKRTTPHQASTSPIAPRGKRGQTKTCSIPTPQY